MFAFGMKLRIRVGECYSTTRGHSNTCATSIFGAGVGFPGTEPATISSTRFTGQKIRPYSGNH